MPMTILLLKLENLKFWMFGLLVAVFQQLEWCIYCRLPLRTSPQKVILFTLLIIANYYPPPFQSPALQVSIFRSKFRPNAGEPVSFRFVLSPGLYCLADVPHLILGQKIFEICKELDYILIASYVVVNLLKSSQVILKNIFITQYFSCLFYT